MRKPRKIQPKQPLTQPKIKLPNVLMINRKKEGSEYYHAIISAEQFSVLIKDRLIKYYAQTQRGLKNNEDDIDFEQVDFKDLRDITSSELKIDEKRVNIMAVKYLLGEPYWTDIIWNIRKGKTAEGQETLEYDDENQTLILRIEPTTPDSAHRHRVWNQLLRWYEDSENIPNQVIVGDIKYSKTDIEELLDNFSLEDELMITIYNLTAEAEGIFFNNMNKETKNTSVPQALNANPNEKASTRFMFKLIQKCPVLSEIELDMRRSALHPLSRKLFPSSAIHSALKDRSDTLIKYENDPKYNDLLDFTSEFFIELSQEFKEYAPKTKRVPRQELRGKSHILSNVILHPLFEMIFELWEAYTIAQVKWQDDKSGIYLLVHALSKTKRAVEGKTYGLMDKNNPEWTGIILTNTGGLINNRSSHKASYNYLSKACNLEHIKQQAVEKKTGLKKELAI